MKKVKYIFKLMKNNKNWLVDCLLIFFEVVQLELIYMNVFNFS